MKKLMLFIFSFTCLLMKSQEFQGKATYFTQFKGDMKPDPEEVKTKEDEELNKLTEEAFKKASQVSFELYFTKTESIYKEIKKLETQQNNSSNIFVSIDMYDCGDIYKNLKEKTTITQRNIVDQEFLVVDILKEFQWQLLNETKKIGNYDCFKAQTTIAVTQQQKEAYEEALKNQSDNKTNLFPPIEPKEKLITAWYTPEIPISQGPEDYGGLPGLILELKADDRTILCTQVILNPKKKVEIKAPRNGKKTSPIEFKKTEKKIYQRQQDEFETRGNK